MKRIMILLLAVLLLGQTALASDADADAAIDAVPDGVRALAGLGKNAALLADETLFRPGDAASDWLAIALALSGAAADYDGYRLRLEAYVTECYRQQGGLHRVKATEYHRTALCVMALGGDPCAFGQKADGTAIDLVADGTYDFAGELGAQGLNAWIFALLTLDAGAFAVPVDARYDRAVMRTAILDAQNEDGGFGLTGDGSDVDITAMALQALAPYAACAATRWSVRFVIWRNKWMRRRFTAAMARKTRNPRPRCFWRCVRWGSMRGRTRALCVGSGHLWRAYCPSGGLMAPLRTVRRMKPAIFWPRARFSWRSQHGGDCQMGMESCMI